MMSNILVQIADPTWTDNALHEACRIARQVPRSNVTLLQLIPVWSKGCKSGCAEQSQFAEYTATAEDYGVTLTLWKARYFRLRRAIVRAVDRLDASVIFATLPPSKLDYLRSWQIYNLERRLCDSGRQLITLEHRRLVTFEELIDLY